MSYQFVIESCTNCASHQWNTRHVEATYQQFCNDVTSKLKELIPGCEVYVNRVPKAWAMYPIYCQLVPNEDPNNEFYDMMPRRGAFEVSTVFKTYDILFFSKLMSQMWPEPVSMTNRINQFKEDS